MNDSTKLHFGDSVIVKGLGKCSAGKVNREPLPGNPYITFRCKYGGHTHTVKPEQVTLDPRRGAAA